MRFYTTLQSGDIIPRAAVAKRVTLPHEQKEGSNTNFEYIFDFTVNGLVPSTSSNNNRTCITNNFNPFTW